MWRINICVIEAALAMAFASMRAAHYTCVFNKHAARTFATRDSRDSIATQHVYFQLADRAGEEEYHYYHYVLPLCRLLHRRATIGKMGNPQRAHQVRRRNFFFLDCSAVNFHAACTRAQPLKKANHEESRFNLKYGIRLNSRDFPACFLFLSAPVFDVKRLIGASRDSAH